MRTTPRTVLAALPALTVAATVTAGEPAFTVIDEVAGPVDSFNGPYVSPDGRLMAWKQGTAIFTWTADGGVTQVLDDDGFSVRDVSNAPPVIVGFAAGGASPSGQAIAARWTEAAGLELLPGVQANSEALGVSADGSVIAGTDFGSPFGGGGEGAAAVKWVDDELVILDSQGFTSEGRGLSSDGRVAVGIVNAPTCDGNSGAAAVWIGSVLDTREMGRATAASSDGRIVGGFLDIRCSPQAGAAIWIEDEAPQVLPFSADPADICDDPLTVVAKSIFTSHVWTPSLGARSARDFLEIEHAIDLDAIGMENVLVTGMSDDAAVFVGFGETASGDKVWILDLEPDDVDTDGDGLLDEWETDGIPYVDQNGDEQRYVLEGADPNHKDLYVEIDTMAGVPIPEESQLDVQFAFATAPVENPDGNDGINLHLVVDEEDLPFEQETPSDEDEFPPGAETIRSNRFGTKAEREEDDHVSRLAAKAKAFRYCLVFNKSTRKIGGHAELPGDDMILYVGGYSVEAKAAVFMHELGHNLGLGHGGGPGSVDEDQADINGKPNYPSIMNYVLAYPEDWNASFWTLDYSREKLATIDENDISELVSVGNGGEGLYDDYFMPFHGIVPVGAECYEEELWGESLISYADLDPSVLTDLNLDCDTDDEQFDADLNFVPGSALPGSIQPSPGETLEGHDDWSNLLLPVDDGGGPYAGRVPTDELTDDQRQYMRENFPPPPAPECLADLDGNGIVDFDDLLAVLSAWGEFSAPEDLDGNGYVDFGDLLIVLATWGACGS